MEERKGRGGVTLILGGARSGKSRYAEGVCASASGARVYLATAPAASDDEEMKRRIAAHRRRRGAGWLTVEEPLELGRRLRELEGGFDVESEGGAASAVDSVRFDGPGFGGAEFGGDGSKSEGRFGRPGPQFGRPDKSGRSGPQFGRPGVALIECLSVWIGNLLHHGRACAAAIADLHAALDAIAYPTVFVGAESGLGITPMGAMSRDYLDSIGDLHQGLAARADRVVLVVAGRPLDLPKS